MKKLGELTVWDQGGKLHFHSPYVSHHCTSFHAGTHWAILGILVPEVELSMRKCDYFYLLRPVCYTEGQLTLVKPGVHSYGMRGE